jgi:hypothetical protein
MKLLKALAFANFQNNIDDYKGDKALLLSPALAPDFNDPKYAAF